MKTKYWILLLTLLLIVCLTLTLWLFRPGQQSNTVQIISRGQVLYTLPLSVDKTVTVETDQGFNTITILEGKVAVTEANCPDGHCKARGFCSGGAQIVCLPHRLVIDFLGQQQLDGISG